MQNKLCYLEGRYTSDRRLQQPGHVVQPLGRVQGLEPGGLVGRGMAQGSQGLETLADAVDVGQVHELDLGVEVVLGTLHPAAPRAVAHGRSVAPRVHDENLPELAPGRGLGGQVLEGGDLAVAAALLVAGAGHVRAAAVSAGGACTRGATVNIRRECQCSDNVENSKSLKFCCEKGQFSLGTLAICSIYWVN